MTAIKKRRWLLAIPVLVMVVICLPVVLLAGAANPPAGCSTSPAGVPSGAAVSSGPAPAGMFASPLRLDPDRWYTVGATAYGGPTDPNSTSFGSSGVDLDVDPNSFAELSVLDTNPAGSGIAGFSFADANALDDLPYGTGLRVRNGNHEAVLYKRDIGYGQGPGQTLPYRIDIWHTAATALNIAKGPVSIELAPSSGAGSVLGALPGASDTGSSAVRSTGTGCAGTSGLALTAGPIASINPSTGMASAPAGAPQAVKALIAAGNQLIDKPYVWGGGHGEPLDEIAAGYDCSGSTSYLLHAGGLLDDYALVAQEFETWDEAGPGQWVTVYANSAHVFIDVAGVVMDTAWYSPVTPTTPSTGPRWQPASMIAAQINGDLAAGNGGFVQRHPEGL